MAEVISAGRSMFSGKYVLCSGQGIGKLINRNWMEAGQILTQNKFEKVDIYGVNINIVLVIKQK